MQEYYSYDPRTGGRVQAAAAPHPAATWLWTRWRSPRVRMVLAISVTALGLFFAVRAMENGAFNAVEAPGHQAAAQTPLPPPPPVDTAAMRQQIDRVIADYPQLEISVSYIDLNSGVAGNHGVAMPFIGASVSKVLTASFYLYSVEQGSRSLDDMVGGQLARVQIQRSIEDSDNEAWHALNDLLGKENLQNYATAIGLKHYGQEYNTITTEDVAHLLRQLYKGDLLNRDHTKLLLDSLARANKHEYIPASIPAGVKVYHKAGWLQDRAHDAAIIDDGKHPYVLVIFTKAAGVNDEQQSLRIIHRVADATVKAFITQPKETAATP